MASCRTQESKNKASTLHQLKPHIYFKLKIEPASLKFAFTSGGITDFIVLKPCGFSPQSFLVDSVSVRFRMVCYHENITVEKMPSKDAQSHIRNSSSSGNLFSKLSLIVT